MKDAKTLGLSGDDAPAGYHHSYVREFELDPHLSSAFSEVSDRRVQYNINALARRSEHRVTEAGSLRYRH